MSEKSEGVNVASVEMDSGYQSVGVAADVKNDDFVFAGNRPHVRAWKILAKFTEAFPIRFSGNADPCQNRACGLREVLCLLL